MIPLSHFSMNLRFVANVAASVDYYAKLFDCAPVEQHPGFAMFVLGDGFRLGLWLRNEVEPTVAGRGGAEEIVFDAADDAGVDAETARWHQLGLPVLQSPTKMDFGYTAVTADPDGHRIRIYKVAADAR